MGSAQARSPLSGAERLADPGAVDQARLAWRLMRDPRVSAVKYALPVLAALYFVSPIDPIPDFLLGIGQVDDLGIIVALALVTMRLLPKLAPAFVVAEHRADFGGQATPHEAPPASGRGGGPVYDGTYRVRD